jgi:hypothetical protein
VDTADNKKITKKEEGNSYTETRCCGLIPSFVQIEKESEKEDSEEKVSNAKKQGILRKSNAPHNKK